MNETIKQGSWDNFVMPSGGSTIEIEKRVDEIKKQIAEDREILMMARKTK